MMFFCPFWLKDSLQYPRYSDERVLIGSDIYYKPSIRVILGAQGHMKGHVTGRRYSDTSLPVC